MRQRRPVFERDRRHKLLRGNKIRSVIGSLPMTKTGRARFPLSVASATKDQSFASPSLVEHPSVSRRIARPPTYGAAWGRARSRTKRQLTASLRELQCQESNHSRRSFRNCRALQRPRGRASRSCRRSTGGRRLRRTRHSHGASPYSSISYSSDVPSQPGQYCW